MFNFNWRDFWKENFPPAGGYLADFNGSIPSGWVFSRSGNAWNPETGQIAPHNLILQSQALATAPWSPTGSPVTVTNNAGTDADGNNAASSVVCSDTTSVGHLVRQTITLVANTTYALSVRVKPNGWNYGYITIGGTGAGGYSTFNYASGTLGSLSASIVSRDIVSDGNGYYKATIVITTGGTVGSNYIEFSIAPTDTLGVTTGVIGAGLYFYGVKLNNYSETSYVPTTSAAVYAPRYLSGKSGQSILVEESSTNVLLYSDDMSQAAWFLPGTGSKTATTVTITDGASAVAQNKASAATGFYTYSVTLSANINTQTQLRITDGADGNPSYTKNVTLTQTPQRFSVSGDFTTGYSGNIQGMIQHGGVTTNGAVITAVNHQIEQKSYATSYIPTTTASVTRPAETLTFDPTGILTAAQGTISAWVNVNDLSKQSNAQAQPLLFHSTSGFNNALILGKTSANVWEFRTGNNVGSISTAVAGALSVGWHHIVGTWGSGNPKLYVDGVLVNTAVDNNLPSTINTSCYVGSWTGGVWQANMPEDQLRIYPTALTAAQVAQLYRSGR